MDHDTALIETIALALGAAFVGGQLVRRVGLPAIVGYLLAGVAIGPFTPGLVADAATATELAELGVILLMFGVGVHFSIPDLLAQRRIAIPGAVGQIAVATTLGTLLGLALGWDLVAGLVLGLAIAVASTVVLLRALIERGELDTPQGRIAIAWLIVEDLFTVGVLVLLPTLAPLLRGASESPAEALAAVGLAVVKVVAFGALMLYVGRRLIPFVLVRVARERSREAFTLAVLAIAIGITYVASSLFGVSFALGAFLAGAVLSESDLSHQAAADAIPLRDAFAVIFFVSIGMLLDPAALLDAWPAVLAVTLLVIGAKSVAAYAIVVALGHPVRVGLTVAAALAQVGEFSFVLATLGRTLELIPDAAFQLVVAASIISITVNPLLFRAIGPIGARIGDRRRSPPEPVDAPQDAILGDAAALRGHAVLVGHGRVGRLITPALGRRGLRVVVVSDDRREVERLRSEGVRAIFGDGSRDELLHAAHVSDATVAVVATPERHTAQLIVERIRDLAPRLPIVVRTHDARQAADLTSLGSNVHAVHAELELAIQMTRFTLRRFGLSATEVDAIGNGIRRRGAVAPSVRPPTAGSGPLESLRRAARRGRRAINLARPVGAVRPRSEAASQRHPSAAPPASTETGNRP